MCRATVWEFGVDGVSLHRNLIARTLIEHVSSADREQRYVQHLRHRTPGQASRTCTRNDRPT